MPRKLEETLAELALALSPTPVVIDIRFVKATTVHRHFWLTTHQGVAPLRNFIFRLIQKHSAAYPDQKKWPSPSLQIALLDHQHTSDCDEACKNPATWVMPTESPEASSVAFDANTEIGDYDPELWEWRKFEYRGKEWKIYRPQTRDYLENLALNESIKLHKDICKETSYCLLAVTVPTALLESYTLDEASREVAVLTVHWVVDDSGSGLDCEIVRLRAENKVYHHLFLMTAYFEIAYEDALHVWFSTQKTASAAFPRANNTPPHDDFSADWHDVTGTGWSKKWSDPIKKKDYHATLTRQLDGLVEKIRELLPCQISSEKCDGSCSAPKDCASLCAYKVIAQNKGLWLPWVICLAGHTENKAISSRAVIVKQIPNETAFDRIERQLKLIQALASLFSHSLFKNVSKTVAPKFTEEQVEIKFSGFDSKNIAHVEEYFGAGSHDQSGNSGSIASYLKVIRENAEVVEIKYVDGYATITLKMRGLQV